MPAYHRWNVTAQIGYTVTPPATQEEELTPEAAMTVVMTELRKLRIEGKPLAIGNITVKEA